MNNGIKLFTGNSNPALAEKIAGHLGLPLAESDIRRFSDGETRVSFEENVRGCDVFLIQSTCAPVNETLMELLIMIDAARRASARRITAVMPYFGYARQDRKDRPRVPITAKLVANLLTESGASRILTLDLHSGQLQGFFDIPVDNLYATPVLVEHLRSLCKTDPVVVSPDAGGVKLARAYAKILGADLAIIDKRRPRPNESEAMHIIGEVSGRTAFILDDLVDTAGTLTAGACALVDAGAEAVYSCCTHAVLSGRAVERLNLSPIREIVVTDTIPLGVKQVEKIKVVSVSGLLAEAISRIHQESSVSTLFVDMSL